jgi:hypothetical protein
MKVGSYMKEERLNEGRSDYMIHTDEMCAPESGGKRGEGEGGGGGGGR